MAAGEQEHKPLVPEAVPTTEPPTIDFEVKPEEVFSTRPDQAVRDSRSTVDAIPPGQMFGQYRVLERLGVGGMGQVYKAVHPVMERVVALKIISPRLMQEPLARARFQREVRNAARLIHPNIVVAHDAAEVEGQWFLVMEYVGGSDLERLLSRHGRPSVELACEIIRQAAVGLQYAHEHGMVHRDIKPANLMVASARPLSGGSGSTAWPEEPLVKILDFGLARLSAVKGESLTHEGIIVGTPEFMSPEQAHNSRSVDIRSDIYSLGCTLYVLLAGRPPFRAANSVDLAELHLHQPPKPVAHYNPALPPELSAVVHRMLAKQPEDRFPTPAMVARALEPWARPGVAAAASPTQPPARLLVEGPVVPPALLMMHFQALLRTILFLVVIAVVGIGCVLYLPDIGKNILSLWHRLTPQTTKTTPLR